MQLITLDLEHNCEVSRLSKLYPEVSIAHWCYSGLELIEIAAGNPSAIFTLDKDLTRLLSLGFKHIRPKTANMSATNFLLLTRIPSRSGLVCVNMEKLGCPPLYPVLYDRGTERYQLVILQDNKLGSLSPLLERQSCKFTIVEKRRIDASEFLERMVSPLPSIVSKLTEKQAESLAVAFARGYYALPKRVSMSEIASRANAKRSTYREHIRKAESKIVGEVVPYLKLVPRKRPIGSEKSAEGSSKADRPPKT